MSVSEVDSSVVNKKFKVDKFPSGKPAMFRVTGKPPVSLGRSGLFIGRFVSKGDKNKLALLQLYKMSLGSNEERKANIQVEVLKVMQGKSSFALEVLGSLSQPNAFGLVTEMWTTSVREFFKHLSSDSAKVSMASYMLCPIIDALACFHQTGHVHGAVCAENVLLTFRGVPVLGNFEYIKAIGEEPKADNESEVYLYAAPEAILEAPISSKSDVFSLSVTFFEIIQEEKFEKIWNIFESQESAIKFNTLFEETHNEELFEHFLDRLGILTLLEKFSTRDFILSILKLFSHSKFLSFNLEERESALELLEDYHIGQNIRFWKGEKITDSSLRVSLEKQSVLLNTMVGALALTGSTKYGSFSALI